MTQRLHDLLERAAETAPESRADPDLLWERARRANLTGRLVTVAVVVALLLVGGLTLRHGGVSPVPVQPTDQTGQVGFPDDLFDIPSRTQTTKEAGLLGRASFVDVDEHKGYWPWSAQQSMVYGASATTGEYRFLDLPGFLLNSSWSGRTAVDHFQSYALMALAPDGSKLAYAYHRAGSQPGRIDGVAVYDLNTGQVASYTPESDSGFLTVWMTWSADSQHLYVGMPSAEYLGESDAWKLHNRDLVTYDRAAKGFSTLPGTASLASVDGVTWKPVGASSPGGLAMVDQPDIVIRDPATADVLARYALPQPSNFQSEIFWALDGDRFVVQDGRCRTSCDTSTLAVIEGSVQSATGRIAVETLATVDDGYFTPFGWAAGKPVGIAGNLESARLVSAGLVSQASLPLTGDQVSEGGVDAAADVLDGGFSSDFTQRPADPHDWRVLPWALMVALFLGFAGLRLRRRGLGLREAWSNGADVVTALLLAGSLAAGLVADQGLTLFGKEVLGSTLLVAMAAAGLAVWRVEEGSRNVQALLVGVTGVLATILTISGVAQLANRHGHSATVSFGVAALMLLQLLLLLSPAIRRIVRPVDVSAGEAPTHG